MDEQQIVEQVRQNLPKVDTPSPDDATVITETTEPGDLHNNLPLQNMILEQQLFDHFNVGRGARQSPEIKQQLATVMEWVKDNANGAEVTDYLNALLHQETLMGIHLKEDKLFRIYKFAKLNQQRLSVENQMKALYGG